MPDESHRPEWAPSEGGAGYASRVLQGVIGGHDGLGSISHAAATASGGQRRGLSIEDYVAGIRAGDRSIFSRAITLVESNQPTHFALAQEVLRQIMPDTGKSIRIGITGVPGAGKSTFIDTFGSFLTEQGHKVAVLAVDPSSSVSRGSILGDKTRMEQLSANPNAYIRPSPTSGMLGGVTRKSRETMLICEAAGYDVIIIETVGVGQSEISVRSMVDFFLLLMITGAGDELQGIKRGIIEIADALVVNKADGDNITRAKSARQEYDRALHYLAPATEGWRSRAYTCSAYTGAGIPEIWDVIGKFRSQTQESGVFQQRRRDQARDWMHALIEQQLLAFFYANPGVRERLPAIEQAVIDGNLPATTAAQELLHIVEEQA